MTRHIVTATLLGVALTACTLFGGQPEGACNEEATITSGTANSNGGSSLHATRYTAHRDVPKQMEVDADAGLVTIRYEREGQQFVEVWRLGPGEMVY